ncbi:OsmC family protein [Arenibaculum sp.]|uniref:OsmC family protein n=1 Tax=Arenibaculum sp. TaxID=2865862 RepID=UPI002E141D40|nr:OsmC family protein [Arenibaculum sp.]
MAVRMKPIARIGLDGLDGYTQRVQARQHELRADEPASHGGNDAGPAPYELLLASLGACTAITLRMYAERKGWELGALHLDLAFFKDEENERVEREVRVGHALSDDQRARLLEICDRTPVTRTLWPAMTITTRLTSTEGQEPS